MWSKGWNVQKMVLVGIFTALMCIGAFLRVPLPPVAVSLQSLVVLLSGLVLGPKLGPVVQVVYIALGLVGVPVFTEGGGIAYIFKPSFGYLLGFIPAAWIIGKTLPGAGGQGLGRFLTAAIGAHLVIYALGLPYLYVALNFFGGTAVPFTALAKTGFLIFLPGDIIKSIFFVAVARRIAGNHTLTSFRESC